MSERKMLLVNAEAAKGGRIALDSQLRQDRNRLLEWEEDGDAEMIGTVRGEIAAAADAIHALTPQSKGGEAIEVPLDLIAPSDQQPLGDEGIIKLIDCRKERDTLRVQLDAVLEDANGQPGEERALRVQLLRFATAITKLRGHLGRDALRAALGDEGDELDRDAIAIRAKESILAAALEGEEP